MKSCLLLVLSLTRIIAWAQTIPATGTTPIDFIPVGYQLLYEGRNRAVGDLNGDRKTDIVLALTSVKENEALQLGDSLLPRLLLVLWRTAHGYRLAAQSRRILMHRSSSAMGDPYNRIAIRRGVLLVEYDIGGSYGRTTIAKFRYQRGIFCLIGETDSYGSHRPDCDKLPYPSGYNYRDVNLLTGEYEQIKVSDDCQLLLHKIGRQKVRPLRTLAAYRPAL